MADLSTLLETAVYNLAVANSTLWNLVDGKMKHGRPAAGWDFPYILYSFPNLPQANVFQSSSPVVASVSIYFDVWSSNDFYAAEAGLIAGYLRTVFDGASLSMTRYQDTVTGYQDTVISRISDKPTQDDETGFWHAQLGYQGMACTT